MNRVEFANKVSAGLGGWFQQLAAQDLERLVGEDAARVELLRMISAQRKYVPDTSARPPNWPSSSKKRIDIAVLGKSYKAKGWYGAIELKWPGKSFDVGSTRQNIVEDAVRVAFATTTNMIANFVILGGTTKALEKIFDTPHKKQTSLERQRRAFSLLFSRNLSDPTKSITNKDLALFFANYQARVPRSTFGTWNRRLKTELISVSHASIGTASKGSVYVWQCKR